MNKLVVEVEKKVEEKVKTAESTIEKKIEKKQELPILEKTENSIQTEYLKSLDNVTIADIKKQEEKKAIAQFEKEKDKLIQEQYKTETQQQESQNIIEKPNYDFIEENKKVVKLRKKITENKKSSKTKNRKVILAFGLAICSVLCVTNITLLDNYSSSLSQIESEFYDVNLPKYLKNIANLDTTKKSMEFLETYPTEMQEAGDLGEETNWYDKLCNFISGIFGG